MDVSHRDVFAICRKAGCGQSIHVSVGRFAGGFNDSGGFIIKCEACGTEAYMRVSNPDDASRVVSGGKRVASWDDEIDDMDDVLAARGLARGDDLPENLLYLETGAKDEAGMFELNDRPIYKCVACGDALEALADTALTQALKPVNDALAQYVNVYLKGYAPTPDVIEVALEVACSCSTHKMSFFWDFVETDCFTDEASKFILAGSEDTTSLEDIDGIYPRDECIEIFKKLLLRWRARDQVVMLVVPFIGLDFKGREQNRMDLWDLVLGHTNPDRTMLVTRKTTWTGFQKAAAKTGLDIPTLRKFGILAPMLEHFHSKAAVFKQQSHAKFYAAIGPEKTELLSGSFNIHSGGYAENLTFRSYKTADFLERYLFPLGVIFDFTQVKSTRQVLEISVQGGTATSTLVKRVS
jgi:hypothetical protein